MKLSFKILALLVSMCHSFTANALEYKRSDKFQEIAESDRLNAEYEGYLCRHIETAMEFSERVDVFKQSNTVASIEVEKWSGRNCWWVKSEKVETLSYVTKMGAFNKPFVVIKLKVESTGEEVYVAFLCEKC